MLFDRETGLAMSAYLDPPDAPSIEVGAHIDPEGHDLYIPKVDGLKLISVPFNLTVSFERLNEVLSAKQYSARALEHCRTLILLFLAGKQNGLSRLYNLLSSLSSL